MAEPVRTHPLNSRQFATDGISVTPVEEMQRISLRCDESAIAAAEKALACLLPRSPKTSASKGDRTALWLGPDEWLVIGHGSGLEAAANNITNDLVSAVVVSHRNTAITVRGPKVEATLNSGCPLDLSITAFPVNACTRTVISKAEVVLWRKGEQEFHVECWRSFSDYVWKFLVDGAKLS